MAARHDGPLHATAAGDAAACAHGAALPDRRLGELGRLRDRQQLPHRGAGVLCDPQRGDAVRPFTHEKVPDRRAGRGALSEPAADPRCPQAQAGPGRLCGLVRRSRQGARRRHGVPLRSRGVPHLLPGTAPQLVPGQRARLRCDRRRRERGHRRHRPAGTAVVQRAAGAGPDRQRGAETLRYGRVHHRRVGRDPVAHRLHRRSGLRDLDRSGACGRALGPADGGGRGPRHPGRRLRGPRFGTHRGRLSGRQRRFHRRRAGPARDPSALAARARPGLAGRLRQGPLQWPPGAARRTR